MKAQQPPFPSYLSTTGITPQSRHATTKRQTVKKLAIAVALAGFAFAAQAQDWSFKDVSANYLDWTSRTYDKTNKGPFGNKKSFLFLEFEGGLGGKWGDLYGFFDLENPTNKPHETDGRVNRRTFWKAVGRFTMFDVGGFPVKAYLRHSDFKDGDFIDVQSVLGLSTDYSSGAFWIQPFFGVNRQNTGFTAFPAPNLNGFMTGWVFGYGFKLFEQSFSVTNWHELEFNRRTEYLQMAQEGNVVTASKMSQNGAASLWWNAHKYLTLGLQYRYAKNKLGVALYQDAVIYTIKSNF